MWRCSVVDKMEIVAGCLADYKQLGRFHYRSSSPGACWSVFVIRPTESGGLHPDTGVCGVIVYSMPSPGLELRDIATGNVFSGFDRTTRLLLINDNIRCISRVIIEPRFRGLGLASWLVRETMPKVKFPIIEAMAVMGIVNPFFEKAGMTAYKANPPVRCVQLIEALIMVGIEEAEFIEPRKVHAKLEQLSAEESRFINKEFDQFLQSYSKSRDMTAGAERTRFILSKLTYRPVYYIWFNPELVNRES